MRRLPVVVGLVALLVAVMLPQAAVAARWRLQSIPNPANGSSLAAVSCTSATACVAVGQDLAQGGVTLAETWNGRMWAIQPTPNPVVNVGGFSAPMGQFGGVSCTSVDFCIAVGGAGRGTLAERWDGHTWTIQSMPNLTSTGGLSAVSCTSADACIAVGQGSRRTTLAERWDGHTWTIQSTPHLRHRHVSALLDGVSCTSANACIAVGGAGTRTLAERWDGHTWTIQATPHLVRGFDNLYGVSCRSANACLAVGEGDTPSGIASLADRWNGHKWTIQSTPHRGPDIFLGVSCTSAKVCVAVGDQGSSRERTLAEHRIGHKWTIKSTPNGPTNTDLLSGVSCTSATVCFAVGVIFPGRHNPNLATLAERYG